MHAGAPASAKALNFPVGHSKHDLLPVRGWKPPAAQGVHFDWPPSENVPVAHAPLHSEVVDKVLP